jgi:oleandomycin transport system ATP-binding protein
VADGTTVLLTTQYLDEADALADEITVIDHGKVIASGTPAELKHVVGGQTIEVRPLDPADLPAVAGILGTISTGRPESPARGVLSVPVAGDAALADVAVRLAAEGIPVAEFSLRLPSLDEVFFALTGRHETSPSSDIAEENAA